MGKPMSKGFLIGWYCFCAILIAFYALSFMRMVQISSANLPMENAYVNVTIFDAVGAFPALWSPILWRYLPSKFWHFVLVGCVVVLALGTAYTNFQAWR